MTGSTLAAILIPPAGMIFLLAWLALVFYAGRDHPPQADRNPAPGRQSPGTAAPASRRQADATGSGARGGDSGPVRQRRRLASPGPGTTIAAVTPAGIVAAQIGGGTMHPELPELSRSAK
jgi:hypothetical protein